MTRFAVLVENGKGQLLVDGVEVALVRRIEVRAQQPTVLEIETLEAVMIEGEVSETRTVSMCPRCESRMSEVKT